MGYFKILDGGKDNGQKTLKEQIFCLSVTTDQVQEENYETCLVFSTTLGSLLWPELLLGSSFLLLLVMQRLPISLNLVQLGLLT